jgi:alanine-synthesizing transaminase
LEEICARRGLALIVDEVFLDYPLDSAWGTAPLESFATGAHPVLTFVLSGMSKIAGLPQMKVGWIVVSEPDGVRRQAMGRLDVVADTFLSMNAPVQLALPAWLSGRQGIQRQILERVRGNLRLAREGGLDVLQVEVGWSAIVRLPQRGGREEIAEELLREAAVVVHPGSFYGIGEVGRVVVSLLGPSTEFEEGVVRTSRFCGREV